MRAGIDGFRLPSSTLEKAVAHLQLAVRQSDTTEVVVRPEEQNHITLLMQADHLPWTMAIQHTVDEQINNKLGEHEMTCFYDSAVTKVKLLLELKNTF